MSATRDLLHAIIDDHTETLTKVHDLVPQIEQVAQVLIDCFTAGQMAFTCGNGGSAAEAQHFSGELIGRFRRQRRPLPCLTLSADTSVLTCTANDFDFGQVFSRQVEALARPGVVLVCFTTSGRSANIVAALQTARRLGATTVLFGGGDGGPAAAHADHLLLSPHTHTARIQEAHTTMMHMVSELIDQWAAGEQAAR